MIDALTVAAKPVATNLENFEKKADFWVRLYMNVIRMTRNKRTEKTAPMIAVS